MAGVGIVAGAGALLAGGAALGAGALIGYKALTKKKDKEKKGKDTNADSTDSDEADANFDVDGKVKEMMDQHKSVQPQDLVNDDLAAAVIKRLELIKKRDRQRKQMADKELDMNINQLREQERQLAEDQKVLQNDLKKQEDAMQAMIDARRQRKKQNDKWGDDESDKEANQVIDAMKAGLAVYAK